MRLNDTGPGELRMDMVYLVYFYAIAVGFVTAGVAASTWALVTGESPRFGLLFEPGVVAPLRALVVVGEDAETELVILVDDLALRGAVGDLSADEQARRHHVVASLTHVGEITGMGRRYPHREIILRGPVQR